MTYTILLTHTQVLMSSRNIRVCPHVKNKQSLLILVCVLMQVGVCPDQEIPDEKDYTPVLSPNVGTFPGVPREHVPLLEEARSTARDIPEGRFQRSSKQDVLRLIGDLVLALVR